MAPMRSDPSLSSGGPGLGTRLVRAFRNLVIVTLVVTCAIAAAWAFSVVNSRTFSTEVRDGKLFVLKGKLLPWGLEPYLPDDPGLAEAYGPLDLEGNTALSIVGARFGDRDELDRGLFSVLELIAKPRVTSDAQADVDKGLVALRRAEHLRGLTEEQKKSLKRMQADVAYSLARTRLDDARKLLDEALQQLKLAADTDTRHSKDATQLLLAIEPQAKVMSDNLRSAVHGLPIAPMPAAPKSDPSPVKPEAAADAGAAAGPLDSDTVARP